MDNQYSSPYPSEVLYRSDKNFIARLKTLVEKSMVKAGFQPSGDSYKRLIDSLEDGEKYLFETRDTPLFWYMQEVSVFGMKAIVLTVHISSNGFKYDLSLPGLHGKDHYRIYNVHQDLITSI